MVWRRLIRIGFQQQSSYAWATVISGLVGTLYAFLYLALWQAVAPAEGAPPYSRTMLGEMVVLTQILGAVALFLPAGLGVHQSVRTGALAVELARPISFYGATISRAAGQLLHLALFRCLPIALVLGISVGLPKPASGLRLAGALLSLGFGIYCALALHFLMGLSALWTGQIRWVHWLFMSITQFLSGGWIPFEVLPTWLRPIAFYSPMASQMGHAVRLYQGIGGSEALLLPLLWAIILSALVHVMTRAALRQVEIQGG
ncbi:MAG TPA: ABC-2 family transporter protein [Symbiobacteriaceae bacterium]|nr:ABC-2 family transporter protein [Symbiobacteriaceae bacterium]